MKKYLLLLFLIPFVSFAQKSISGVIKDSKTNAPLAFANIVTNTNKGTITDIDGKFEIQNANGVQSITISYIGYRSKEIIITPSKSFYSIQLEENVEQLNEVTLTGGENPAIQIIRNAIKNRRINNPEKALNSFKFNTYNKLLITANPDSINNTIDSVYKKKNGKLELLRVDSSNYELKKQLDRSHLYISEKVSEFAFTKAKGKRETILANHMAGFQEPVYEILALQIQSFSFYENTYTLFGTDYVNPLANNALRKYDYKILDTINKGNRPAYMIYYFPKKKGDFAGLEGVLYVDTETYALQKAIAQLKAVIDIKATQTFKYFENEKTWFPVEKEVKIEKGMNDENISLFGGIVSFKSGIRDSTLVRTNEQDETDLIYLISKDKNFDIQLNQPIKIRGSGLAVDLLEEAGNRDEDFWNQYRTENITDRGKETYVVLDSIIEEEKIEKKIGFFKKLIDGYFPTRYLDFDLRYLLKYNNFEGFKPGVGAITNDKFSKKYRLSGYGIYGFKDEDFKFGLTAAARLNRFTSTWAGISYTDDLTETGSDLFNTDGRAFYVFEPRLFNLISFYKNKKISAYIEHDLTAKLQGKLQLNRSRNDPQFEYTFVNNGVSITNFNIASAQLSFQWSPFNEYILTPVGKKITKQGFPQVTFQATQSFENVLDSDFNFTKLNLRLIHEIRPIDKAVTSFLVKAGIGFGDIPLTHLYHTSPNNPVRDNILERFAVADINSFETMFFNEFFSDRYATFQVRHKLNPFKIAPKFRPQLSLVSRFAIGDLSNPERQVTFEFDTLEDGFYESGIELDRLFAGFGISLFYRYGPNHLPRFDDNISFKFTFNFDFGF
ncbi:carboxypeptidase-like regulatory domain-containing protein [Flavobacteriaceae bacterium R38]|nr:carboxypeptidase-like regulatory domain-containing protein [Flavobacteriaceae bacterium R38]